MGFIDYYFKGIKKIQEKHIASFISQKIEENKNLDYKDIRVFDDPDKLAVSISSFANSEGGLLLLGVSEETIGEKGKERIYPNKITWGGRSLTKETLENKIVSRISPPIEGLEIRPVRNKAKQVIFLIDIPKSRSAPHMATDNCYHGRLNFRTIPLEHYQVSTLFRLNWLLKEKISMEIIQPIYGEISAIIENIPLYQPLSIQFKQLLYEKKYLFDQIDEKLRGKIIDFYKRAEKYKEDLDYVIKILLSISSKNAHKYFGASKTSSENLRYHIESNFRATADRLGYPLLRRMKPAQYFKELHPRDRIKRISIEIETPDGHATTLPMTKEIKYKFDRVWEKCLSDAKRELLVASFWKETVELPKLGKEILEDIKMR